MTDPCPRCASAEARGRRDVADFVRRYVDAWCADLRTLPDLEPGAVVDIIQCLAMQAELYADEKERKPMTDYPPPGPELDALVAKAMGKEVRRVPDDRGRLVWEFRAGDFWMPMLAYSTTGNGMLKMLEWMRAKPRCWVVRLTVYPASCCCDVRARGIHGHSEVPPAPHAAALALLDAAGAQGD